MRYRKILSVMSDVRLSGFLRERLNRQGYQVHVNASLDQAMHSLNESKYDSVICAERLVDGEAIDVIERLKEERSKVPVMVVFDTTDRTRVVEYLKSGADDCVAAPVSIEEVVQRTARLLSVTKNLEFPRVELANMLFHAESGSVWFREKVLQLRPKEYELFYALARHSPGTVGHDGLVECVWPAEETPTRSTVSVYIRRLRMRLKRAHFPTIETVRGFGYRVTMKGIEQPMT